MLVNFEELCVVDMNNATYHLELAEDYPKAQGKCSKMARKKSVIFSLVETLCELREKV